MGYSWYVSSCLKNCFKNVINGLGGGVVYNDMFVFDFSKFNIFINDSELEKLSYKEF